MIDAVNTPGRTGGHTTDDVRPDGSLGMQPRIVLNAMCLSPQHREQLLAHELIHARRSCAEAQGQPRPHVAVEEVEAYWKGGSCDEGGYHRHSGQSKCECVEQNAVASCVMAGLPQDECRQVVRQEIVGSPYNCA